jgi:hypothetical protein
MQPTQQKFLLEAMEYLGLTKNALAIKLNTSEYTINSWLLSEDRPGFARLSEFIHEKISSLVQEKKSANFFHIHTASKSERAPGKYCEKYQFHFPSLYRATSAESVTYTLSDQPDADQPDAQFEAIPHLNAELDRVWVFINEHSSMNAVLGYWRAISHSNPDSVSSRFKLYLFEDHLFSIYHINKPDLALLDNIIFYQIDDNEVQIAMPSMRRNQFEDWSLIIDGEGNEKQKSQVWKE